MNITALLAGLFSGIAGSMGLGGGAVLIIYLTLLKNLPPSRAAGINLLFFIPISLLAVLIYWRQGKIRWKRVLPLSLFGFLGAAAGFFIKGFLGGTALQKLFGALLVYMGLRETFAKSVENQEK